MKTFLTTLIAWMTLICANAQSVLCPPLDAGPDTALCSSGTVQLYASTGYTNYSWSPASGLSNPAIANPVATIGSAMSYTVTASTAGPNLFANPDFSFGNTGFSSGHFYSTTYSPWNYWVGPSYFSISYPSLVDHTPTSDNYFMCIDGATSVVTLWEQTVPVTTSTNYTFEFWASKADAVQPIFEVHMIGNVTGDVIVSTIPGIPYTGTWSWDLYSSPVWNSGPNTSVTVRIVNLETNGYGNDFGLDDMYFGEKCEDTDTVTINFGSIAASVSGPAIICEGSSATLTASGGGSYSWSTGASSASVSVSPAAATSYSVVVTTGGCTDTVYHLLNVDSVPVVSISGDSVLCAGESSLLSASGAASYTWSTSQTGASITVSPAFTTTYTVTGTSPAGCSDNQLFTVHVNPLPAPPVVADTNVCVSTVPFPISATGTSLTWYDANGNTSSITPIQLTDAPGSFSYNVTQTVNGCESAVSTATVLIEEAPFFSLGGALKICEEDSLLAGPADSSWSFVWHDGSTVSPRPISESGSYTLTAANSCGSYTDVLSLNSEKCECSFYVPNAFTPNANGRNDQFRPEFSCDIRNYSMQIFNRWGEMIYETAEPLQAWDGTFKGTLCEGGVYTVRIVYEKKATTYYIPAEYTGMVVLVQ